SSSDSGVGGRASSDGRRHVWLLLWLQLLAGSHGADAPRSPYRIARRAAGVSLLTPSTAGFQAQPAIPGRASRKAVAAGGPHQQPVATTFAQADVSGYMLLAGSHGADAPRSPVGCDSRLIRQAGLSLLTPSTAG